MTRRSGCGGGGWCWAGTAPTAPAASCGGRTPPWTRRSAPSTGAAARTVRAAGARARRAWAPRRRTWPAGWGTSVRTSPPPSSRSCSATRSNGSACRRCCWNRRCWRPSRPMCTWWGRCSRSTRSCRRRRRRPPGPWCARSSSSWRHSSRPVPAPHSAVPWTGRRASAAPGTGTSTGTARSARTSRTTCPNIARSSRNGWSATAEPRSP